MNIDRIIVIHTTYIAFRTSRVSALLLEASLLEAGVQRANPLRLDA